MSFLFFCVHYFVVSFNVTVVQLLLYFLDFNSNFFEFKMSNYAENCLKNYVKTKKTFEVQIRFEICPTQIVVYYYYDNEDYFDLLRTIRNLYKYLQKHNMHLNWKTYPNVEIDNLTGPNDSKIFFNRSIKRLTRLIIKKR